MKNLLCKHCAFIAAIFAVCLFVTSCDNPVTPGQKPNPEPAPSPAPQPAPAPSIEVPAPQQEPSTDTGASTPQTPAPAADEAVETENITVTLQSISAAAGGYGILANFGTQTVIVPVPKSLTGVADRAEKVKEQLLYKLEAEGYSGCVLCDSAGTGVPAMNDLLGTSGNPVYVKQLQTQMKVQITIQSIAGDKVIDPPSPDAGTYKPCNEAFVNTIVFATVMNTDAAAAQQAALKAAVDHKIGAGYGCFVSPTAQATGTGAAFAVAGNFTNNGTIYVGKKLP